MPWCCPFRVMTQSDGKVLKLLIYLFSSSYLSPYYLIVTVHISLNWVLLKDRRNIFDIIMERSWVNWRCESGFEFDFVFPNCHWHDYGVSASPALSLNFSSFQSEAQSEHTIVSVYGSRYKLCMEACMFITYAWGGWSYNKRFGKFVLISYFRWFIYRSSSQSIVVNQREQADAERWLTAIIGLGQSKSTVKVYNCLEDGRSLGCCSIPIALALRL